MTDGTRIFTFGLATTSVSRTLATLHRPPTRATVPGLIHAECLTLMRLGSATFSPHRMQLRQLTMFAAWENEQAIDDFLSKTELGHAIASGWHLRMSFLRRWGSVREIVDYLGTHQHLAVDIHLSVADNGGLRLMSGEQRFYEGPLGFKFPMLFSGIASVCEWFDDTAGKFRIEVEVRNKLWGPLFGYSGAFDVEWVDVDPGCVPDGVRPIREEARY